MLDILYEDNHCLIINKPAGLPTQGDSTGDRSLVDLAGTYLKEKYQKPGNVYVGLVHRLDRPTSGVVLLARTSKAASRLAAQFRDGDVEKVYWAIVEGTCLAQQGEWADTLLKDEQHNIVDVVPRGTPGGRDAALSYRVVERMGRTSWLEIRPATGRSHQIRVQLASRGLPVVGDRKYGAISTLMAADGKPRVALHARSLSFKHPTREEVISVTAEAPRDWPATTPSIPPGRLSS